MTGDEITLTSLRRCLRGGVPAIIATAAADGTPNVTYLSTVHLVDEERVALSNQFFSKTSRNLAENPRASVLVTDPLTYDEYRLDLSFERTERRGPLFESLRGEVDAVAALSGMQEVFRLKAADVYRVTHIEAVLGGAARRGEPGLDVPAPMDAATAAARLAELSGRIARAADLDVVVGTTVAGLDELLGYPHSLLALRDERGERLYVIASHGYETEGVGSELAVGDGPIGLAAQRGAPVRIGAVKQMAKYGRTVRRSFEAGGFDPVREIPLPSLPDGESLVAVPAMASGQLVGVLVVESTQPVAFDETDQALLSVVATLLATAVEADRRLVDVSEGEGSGDQGLSTPPSADADVVPPDGDGCIQVRCFGQDGSVFLDGDYLIKGVAGRILTALLRAHEADGRVDFTNRELRLDPSLGLPEYRDNLESRLILLKRRLDERAAPVRIDKTGRGRFRLDVSTEVRVDVADFDG
ncbi:MAG: GAF domain-containing protein [Acidimicrobiales bacterium]